MQQQLEPTNNLKTILLVTLFIGALGLIASVL